MTSKRTNVNKKVIAICYAIADLIILLLSLYLGKLLGGDNSNFFDKYIFIIVNVVSFYIFSVIFRMYLFDPATVTTSYVLKASIVYGLTAFITFIFSIIFSRFSLGDRWLVCYLLIFLVLYMASRVFYRIYLHVEHVFVEKTDKEYQRAIIVGAGIAASLFIREVRLSNKNKIIPVCLLDDNKNKQNTEVL
ncbi:MAG: hypothetical protein IJW26_06435, partial [Clostridia bacterium]|nr:hypothetical protein [Clostridia bacterium]